jgi:hypothetical protein
MMCNGWTRRLLEYALRRVQEEHLAVLVSVRTGAAAAALPLELETFAGSRREVVRLGPLSLAALHRLLRDRLGLSPSRPVLVRIHRAAAGNPFYALEIARLLKDGDGLLQGRLPVPGQVTELLAARLRRLPAATREALLVAACLSRPGLELLDGEALAPAEQAGIVSVLADGRVAFTHPLFASAVYDGAPAARRPGPTPGAGGTGHQHRGACPPPRPGHDRPRRPCRRRGPACGRAGAGAGCAGRGRGTL